MRLTLGLGLVSLALAAAAFVPAVASAASTTCMGPDGSCEISNVPDDMLTCNCADGSGGGYGGGNMWAGLTEMELQPICDLELSAFCGAPPPPTGIPCGTANGDCFIDNDPFDSIDCECADGSGFGYGGGNSWAGLSDPELVMICETIVDTECAGGPPPPPPPPEPVECSSRLGSCSVSNVPEDFVSCECADGLGGESSGGSEWSGLSPEELEAVCDAQIVLFCAEMGTGTAGETGEDTGSHDTGHDTGEDTGGGTTEGHDDSGTGGESGVGETGGGSTGGGETGATGSTGSQEDGGGEGGGKGGGCSVASPGQTGGAFMLTLLGLLGLGRRRRRAA